jgi:intracellular multiplication protein IcmL
MAEEEAQVVELRDDFYRDSFGKVVWLIIAAAIAVACVSAMFAYLYLTKPPPITFAVGDEWRIQPPVPLDQPYRTTPDLLQWVSDALPRVFQYDFNNYNDQLKNASQYFTTDGWKVFLNQLNNYVNYNNVQTYKLFVSGTPASAPFILNQGLILGRYGWWVQMPLTLRYIGNNRNSTQDLTLQVLVVRVPTRNNLSGIGIDNVIVEKSNIRSPARNG